MPLAQINPGGTRGTIGCEASKAPWSEYVALGGRKLRTRIAISEWAKGQLLWLKPYVIGVAHVWSGLRGTLNTVGDLPHAACGKLLRVSQRAQLSFPLVH